MQIARRYATALRQGRAGVLLFWVVMLGVGAWLGPKLITATTNSFEPPSDSEAARANAVLAHYFPALNPMDSSFVVYVYELTRGGGVLNPAVEAFEASLRAAVAAYDAPDCGSPCIQTYASYYSLIEQGLPPSMADALVSPANASTIFTINVAIPFASSHAVTYAQFLQRQLTALRPDGPYGVVLIGLPAFMPLMQSSIERDMGLMDGIVLPIALLVLCYVIRSVRLMLLPLAATAVSALTSFMLVYGVAQKLDIISFVPSLMMSLLLAMGFDYELFLLTRYSEALRAGHDPFEAVVTMLATAGHTILVSGATLTVCFLGLVIFPLDLMISTGVGCALAVSVTLLVNITLTPTLLLTFPDFFARSIKPFSWASTKAFWCGACSGGARPHTPTGAASDAARARLSTPESRPVALAERAPLLATLKAFEASPGPGAGASTGLASSTLTAVEAQEHHAFVNDRNILRSLWYKIGWVTQTRPYNVAIVVVVIAATIVFDLHALNYTASDAIALDLPRSSDVTDAYLTMCTDFGYGTVYPYWLLMELPASWPHPGGVLSDQAFAAAHTVVETLATLPGTTTADFTSVVYGDGLAIPYVAVAECETGSFPAYNSSTCRGLRSAAATFVSADKRALLFEFAPSFDPISKFGHRWYKEGRSSLNYLSGVTGASFYLAGMPADSWSAIESAYYWFPIMISITTSVVLVMVGLAFRSILVPLRAVITIGVTNLFVYGAATLTYEYSLLEWTHIAGLRSIGAIEWLPPVVVLPILVGCALDYDIFLLVRIQEYRGTGLATKDAIVKGVTKTGAIISAAGVLMAIAFSGLLLSDVTVINQLAFYLVFGCLFDTFVVRPLLVPALMSEFREANWWPGARPPVALAPLPAPLAGWNPLFMSCRGDVTDPAIVASGLLEPATPVPVRYGP